MRRAQLTSQAELNRPLTPTNHRLTDPNPTSLSCKQRSRRLVHRAPASLAPAQRCGTAQWESLHLSQIHPGPAALPVCLWPAPYQLCLHGLQTTAPAAGPLI